MRLTTETKADLLLLDEVNEKTEIKLQNHA